MATAKVFDLKEFAKEGAAKTEGNKVQKMDMLSSDGLRVRAVVSTKGEWPLKVEKEQHVFIVLSGTITFEVAPVREGKPVREKAQKHRLSAGQAIRIPANMAHGGVVSSSRTPALAAEVLNAEALARSSRPLRKLRTQTSPKSAR